MQLSKSQQKLFASLALKKYRDAHGLFVVEGVRANDAFLRAGTFPCVALVKSSNDTPILPSIPIYEATTQQIQQISQFKTPSSCLGVYRMVAPAAIDVSRELVLVLDDVQDPGNMGTIIRTCDWFDIRHLVCSRATVDCFNAKVVQASMGSLCRVHVHYVELSEWLQAYPHAIFAATLNGTSITSLPTGVLTPPLAIMVGNEGAGISKNLLSLATQQITIPTVGAQSPVDSMNVAVASAILCFHFRSARRNG